MAQPAILVLVGASGAGKTTLVQSLESLQLPGVGCYYCDTIGVPSAEAIAEHFGGGASWQAWALDRWLTRLIANDDAVALAVLDAQARPSAVYSAFRHFGVERGHVVLIDYDYAERNARLRGPRGQPELANWQMDTWAAYLRGQADALDLPIISTTNATIDACLQSLRREVERALQSSQ